MLKLIQTIQGMNVLVPYTLKIRHPKFDCHKNSPRLPDTQIWQVISCICGLLPKSGSKGSCLGEVPHHQIKNLMPWKPNKERNLIIYTFSDIQRIILVGKERSNSSIQEAFKRSFKNKLLYSEKFKKIKKIGYFSLLSKHNSFKALGPKIWKGPNF